MKAVFLLFSFLTLSATSLSAQVCAPATFTGDCWFTKSQWAGKYSPDGAYFAVVSESAAGSPYVGTDGQPCPGGSGPHETHIFTRSSTGYGHIFSSGNIGTGVGSVWTQSNYFFSSYLDRGNVFNAANEVMTTNILPSGDRVSDVYHIPGTDSILVFSYINGSSEAIRLLHFSGTPTNISTNTILSGDFTSSGFRKAIAATDTRIYYAIADSHEEPADNFTARIKCIDYNGNACSNWSDVDVPFADVLDLRIRPTDGLIFARISLNDPGESNADLVDPDHRVPATGVYVFDSTGVLQTDFNYLDLSLLVNTTQDQDFDLYELRIDFDTAGNIYANMPVDFQDDRDVNDYIRVGLRMPAGVLRFDPMGNLDIGFMRNVMRSYLLSGASEASGFDIEDNSGEIAIAHQAKDANANSRSWRSVWYSNTDPINIDNGKDSEDFYISSHYPASGTTMATNFNQPNWNYQQIHFWFNSGYLNAPGMSAGQVASNCGYTAPVIVPSPPAAGAGTIDCPKTMIVEMPQQGTASDFVMYVTIDVTTAGVFSPITITGSGFSLQDPNFVINAANTGTQVFAIPLSYDGTTVLGSFDITAGSAGTCNGDLTDNSKEVDAEIKIWTSEKCALKIVGPKLK